jgi:hypothetical protein
MKMTCPSCGRIAGAGLERCPSCNSSLAIPTDRPEVPTPIVRAPTNRGELAQRAAGIFAQSLVPSRPGAVPDQPWAGSAPRPGLMPAPPPPPPAGGLAGEPAPVAPHLAGADGRYHEPAKSSSSNPSLAPPDARSASVAPGSLGTGPGWATLPPTPPAPFVVDPYAADTATRSHVPSAHAALDATAVFPVPAPGARDHPGADVARAGDEPADEARPRTVRPGVDAAWPPPPGPWSGRRTSES